MGKWSNIFNPDSRRLDEAAFEQLVLESLTARYGEIFSSTDERLVLALGERRFGLQNLWAIYEKDRLDREALRTVVIEHFDRMLAELDEERGPAPLHWSEVRPRLRPQFMPAEYLEQAPAPLLFFPLNEDVAIGVVVDQSNTYAYVRAEDAELWGVPADAVFEMAIENLNAASADIPMHSGSDPDRFIAIEAGDGYDAARLLIPGLRAFIADHLGSPFFAGIPNRDFLICWARDASQEFQDFAREKIAADNAEQPYSLTAEVLIATSETITPESAS
ncbi:MAG TPA: DUF1444 family protein [Thermoanaerobaculia bacterium]